MTNVYKTAGDRTAVLADMPFIANQDWAFCCWIMTEQCNLGCKYCIHGSRDMAGEPGVLNRYGVDAVAQALLRMRDAVGRNMYLLLTGGEPTTMKSLAPLMRRLVAEGFKLHLQTNLFGGACRKLLQDMDPNDINVVEAACHVAAIKDRQGWDAWWETARMVVERGHSLVFKRIGEPSTMKELIPLMNFMHEREPSVPIYVRPCVGRVAKGAPRYPEAYTAEERALLAKVMLIRRTEHQMEVDGAGPFPRMVCEAGERFFYLAANGQIRRCIGDKRLLGHLMGKDFRILRASPCERSHCSAPRWAALFGRDPWEHVKGYKPEDCPWRFENGAAYKMVDWQEVWKIYEETEHGTSNSSDNGPHVAKEIP